MLQVHGLNIDVVVVGKWFVTVRIAVLTLNFWLTFSHNYHHPQQPPTFPLLLTLLSWYLMDDDAISALLGPRPSGPADDTDDTIAALLGSRPLALEESSSDSEMDVGHDDAMDINTAMLLGDRPPQPVSDTSSDEQNSAHHNQNVQHESSSSDSEGEGSEDEMVVLPEV